MQRRKLGQGLEVSALSLGAMGYGKAREIPDRPEMIALLRAAVDRGMEGIGLVPFSPLGKGFLTGKMDASTPLDASDFRARIPRFAPEARDANQKLVALIRAIGERHGASPAQVALAWLLAKKPWIVPLFGTRKLERFEENIGSLNVTLSADDIAHLERGSEEIGVTGQRYPDEAMRQVGL